MFNLSKLSQQQVEKALSLVYQAHQNKKPLLWEEVPQNLQELDELDWELVSLTLQLLLYEQNLSRLH
jgi:hypothetical protein